MIASGDYDGAAAWYLSIEAYSMAQEAQYQKGESLLAEQDSEAAAQAFASVVGYRDAIKRSYQIRYQDLHEGKIAVRHFSHGRIESGRDGRRGRL